MTFDTEDFISPGAIAVLHDLLEQLKASNFKALFFVTGHMAERLADESQIIGLLREHEIGYHSSGHSTHPAIFEFTDVEDYQEAYNSSKLREISHIDPLTGDITPHGGLLILRSLFPSKQIVAFRAPGCCWSPPHLEALRDLGIRFDFSSSMYSESFSHKNITFYPYPNIGDWQSGSIYYRLLILSVLRNHTTVADLHPSFFLNQEEWDSIYWKKNPTELVSTLPRKNAETSSLLEGFGKFLKTVKHLEKLGMLQTSPNLIESQRQVSFDVESVMKCYEHSVRWPVRRFNYEPRFSPRSLPKIL